MSKNTGKTFLQILLFACLVFTGLILLICFGIGLAGAEEKYGIFPSTAFGIFGFSLAFSCITVVCSKLKIPFFVRAVLHLAVTLAISAACLRLANGLDGKTVLITVLVIAVFHIAACVIIYAVKRKSGEEKEYKSVYGKLKNNGEDK